MAKVALALGSGGARGYAHIGVLQVLAERGHEVSVIAGTSMGALVGGVTAAGKLDEFTTWATSLTQRDVWRLIDPALSGAWAMRAERVIAKVDDIIDKARIEDLAIPFTAVATDFESRREVWFQHGPVATAVRASIAIPGVISPIVVDGRIMVDGAVTNPVPIEPTSSTPADFTVAVSLSGPRVAALAESGTPLHTFQQSWRAFRTRVRRGDEPDGEIVNEPSYQPAPRDLSSLDVFSQAFDTMTSLVTRYRMAAIPPDVLVTVPADACRTMDFHRATEMIALGRKLGAEALDRAGFD